jgi:hypothetical protein
VTVTLPVGSPLPGELAATVTFTTMGSPTTGIAGVVPVIEVVVESCPTVTPTPLEFDEE